jgi:hypothetical protein
VNFPTKLIRIDFLVWNDNVFFFLPTFYFIGWNFLAYGNFIFQKKEKKMKKEKIEVVGSLLKKECIYIYFFKI